MFIVIECQLLRLKTANNVRYNDSIKQLELASALIDTWMLSEKALLLEYTLKRISNWLPVIWHIVGKLFGENYKYPHISLIQITPNI